MLEFRSLVVCSRAEVLLSPLALSFFTGASTVREVRGWLFQRCKSQALGTFAVLARVSPRSLSQPVYPTCVANGCNMGSRAFKRATWNPSSFNEVYGYPVLGPFFLILGSKVPRCLRLAAHGKEVSERLELAMHDM